MSSLLGPIKSDYLRAAISAVALAAFLWPALG